MRRSRRRLHDSGSQSPFDRQWRSLRGAKRERERLTRRWWWANAALRCQEGAAFYSTSMISHGGFELFHLDAKSIVGDGYSSVFLPVGKWCLTTTSCPSTSHTSVMSSALSPFFCRGGKPYIAPPLPARHIKSVYFERRGRFAATDVILTI